MRVGDYSGCYGENLLLFVDLRMKHDRDSSLLFFFSTLKFLVIFSATSGLQNIASKKFIFANEIHSRQNGDVSYLEGFSKMFLCGKNNH